MLVGASTAKVVCLSTTEAELAAFNSCIKEVLWAREVVAAVGRLPGGSVPIQTDSDGARGQLTGSAGARKSKHFLRAVAWGRQQVARGVVHPVRVDSAKNVADGLTKALPKWRFLRDRVFLLGLQVPVGGGAVFGWEC